MFSDLMASIGIKAKLSDHLKTIRAAGNKKTSHQFREQNGQFGGKNEAKIEKANRRDFAKAKAKLIKIKSKQIRKTSWQ